MFDVIHSTGKTVRDYTNRNIIDVGTQTCTIFRNYCLVIQYGQNETQSFDVFSLPHHSAPIFS